MNCPSCGSAVKEGRFCNYCGAKLPDDTKRIEVNVNKRIEDVAEIKRADYETEESKLRQKRIQAEFRSRKARRVSCVVFIFVFLAMFLWVVFKPSLTAALLGGVGGGSGLIFLVGYIIYLLVTGKW